MAPRDPSEHPRPDRSPPASAGSWTSSPRPSGSGATPPTVREIGEAVGLTSSSSVHAQLANLERRGLLTKDPTKPRAMTLSEANRAEGVVVPLVGRIAAGTPVLAEQNVEEHLVVPMGFAGDAEHFALTVTGDSMVDAGILDGDVVDRPGPGHRRRRRRGRGAAPGARGGRGDGQAPAPPARQGHVGPRAPVHAAVRHRYRRAGPRQGRRGPAQAVALADRGRIDRRAIQGTTPRVRDPGRCLLWSRRPPPWDAGCLRSPFSR